MLVLERDPVADHSEGEARVTAGAPTRRELSLVALVFVGGLALRLALVASTPGLELYGDQAVYAAEAARILDGERSEGYRGPGYPAFLAGCQWLLGRDPVAGRIGNALAGGLMILVFWALTRTIFSPRAAQIAASLLAFYPRAVLMPQYLLAENTYGLLLMIGIWMAIRATEGAPRATCVAAGAAFGFGALTREMLVYFVPAVVLVLLLLSRLTLRERVLRTALLVGTALVVVAPWTIRNYSVLDEFVLIGFSDGIPLFEGNYVAATPKAVFEKRVSLSNRYLEEAERAGVEAVERRLKIMNDRIKEDAWTAIRERQPTWIFEKIASNVPRILRPNVRNEVLLGQWPMPAEEQRRLSKTLLFTLFLPVHVLLLLLGPVGLAHWRLASAGVLPVLYLGFSFAVHIVGNAAHYRFEFPYEWVLLTGVAVTLDRGLPETRTRRVVAVVLAGIAIGSQFAIPDIWRSGFG
jgi:4-amino-4-deoxy-L-arabinose transferase-like glycosyltransferase